MNRGDADPEDRRGPGHTLIPALRSRIALAIASALLPKRTGRAKALVQALKASLTPGDARNRADAIARGLRAIDLSADETGTVTFALLENLRSGVPAEIVRAFEEATGGSLHFSQEGEDIFLERYFSHDRVGFFVDIGAHHPTRFSNTYTLYRRGWRGINVDAMPGSMVPFQRLRPEDINLECAVSDTAGSLILHVFEERALNTVETKLADDYVRQGWELEGRIEVRTLPLSAILNRHLPAGQQIDLFSIDVEGSELGVLRSNDWAVHRPEVIVLEVIDVPLDGLPNHEAIAFLRQEGYAPVARFYSSVILLRRG